MLVSTPPSVSLRHVLLECIGSNPASLSRLRSGMPQGNPGRATLDPGLRMTK